MLLAALGLSGPLFGTRLLPVGTLYDPFISRGLDALNYACYQDARFILVATPSGVSLAPEGGAHQSVLTPLIGLGQPGLTAFEPAYVDELAEILRWSFEHVQAEDGGAVYLRLSTRPLAQPRRGLTPAVRADIVAGGYWLAPPAPGAELALVVSGPVVVEAVEAHRQIAEDVPGAGVLVVTSADRLQRGWMRAVKAGRPERARVRRLLEPLAPDGGARHGARRPSRHAVLAGIGGAAPGPAPRGHPVRAVGRHPRPLPGVRARRRRHTRCRGAPVRLTGGPSRLNEVIPSAGIPAGRRRPRIRRARVSGPLHSPTPRPPRRPGTHVARVRLEVIPRGGRCMIGVMSRTNVDVDDEACAAVMRRYRLATKREAVNFALRSLASEPFSLEEARQMRGSGWDGDLDEMRGRGDGPR